MLYVHISLCYESAPLAWTYRLDETRRGFLWFFRENLVSTFRDKSLSWFLADDMTYISEIPLLELSNIITIYQSIIICVIWVSRKRQSKYWSRLGQESWILCTGPVSFGILIVGISGCRYPLVKEYHSTIVTQTSQNGDLRIICSWKLLLLHKCLWHI